VSQSSTRLLQSWRANCDVQLLIYDSSPDNFDLKEVSKVTDYVVAYSCKGNHTLKEEIETYKRIILGAEEVTGDRIELQSVCKRVLNKAASSRLISKQEATVLLANMDLHICSEQIECVSITKSTKITIDKVESRRATILTEYENRPSVYEDLSLHDFFPIYRALKASNKPHKITIPHYTGLSGEPTFPVNETYARHVLIVYKPWREYPNPKEWLREFNDFIRSKQCPKSCRLHYDRVMQRYYEGTKFVEPTVQVADYSKNDISQEDVETLMLAGLGDENRELTGELALDAIHKGKDYRWDKEPMVSNHVTKKRVKSFFSTSPKISYILLFF
jgi:hypothetical protein